MDIAFYKHKLVIEFLPTVSLSRLEVKNEKSYTLCLSWLVWTIDVSTVVKIDSCTD